MELEILHISLPRVSLRVVCSKGTYIRTLCADIGEKLGCGGIMESLVRTRCGEFALGDAVTLGELERLRDEGRLGEVLRPVDSCFGACPALHVADRWQMLVDNGNPFLTGQTVERASYPAGQWVRVYRESGSFVGVYAFDGEQSYRPVKMFL